MAVIAVLHHDKPALQGFCSADSACCHLLGSCLEHLFHEHRAVRETSVLAIGADGPWRCIDDMELLCTVSLLGCHRPASQQLIEAAIGIGHMQIPGCIVCGLRLCPPAGCCRVHLPIGDDRDQCRHSCDADN